MKKAEIPENVKEVLRDYIEAYGVDKIRAAIREIAIRLMHEREL